MLFAETALLGRGQQTFSVKGQMLHVLGLAGHAVTAVATRPL